MTFTLLVVTYSSFAPASIIGSQDETHQIECYSVDRMYYLTDVTGHIELTQESYTGNDVISTTGATMLFDDGGSSHQYATGWVLTSVAYHCEWYINGVEVEDSGYVSYSAITSSDQGTAIALQDFTYQNTVALEDGDNIYAGIELKFTADFDELPDGAFVDFIFDIGFGGAEITTDSGSVPGPIVKYTVRGYVLDSVSETPISGVFITADDDNTTSTDASGYYSIILETHDWSLTYEKPGYESKTKAHHGNTSGAVYLVKEGLPDDGDEPQDEWGDEGPPEFEFGLEPLAVLVVCMIFMGLVGLIPGISMKTKAIILLVLLIIMLAGILYAGFYLVGAWF